MEVDKVPIYRARSENVACTLTADELKDTQKAWRKLFGTGLISREEIPGGIRLVVNDGSADALRQLIDVERECCPWITFDLRGPVVTMTADADGEAAIREMWSTL
ncbi:MAG TPA: hypothetical protein VHO95_03640 [Candidatus Dormibacteraeota bacterium]|nr:hypothetical protein [Candidatus Dormibacteraeota bacterium]HEX2680116.1 hypothetical protein [Candidatus Dormibacteraeota bacterium]